MGGLGKNQGLFCNGNIGIINGGIRIDRCVNPMKRPKPGELFPFCEGSRFPGGVTKDDKECKKLSDFYRDQPDSNDFYQKPAQEANSEWNKATYANGEGAQSSDGTDPYSAWRRPSGGSGSFLDDDPAPFGPEIQQGGVPLSNADMSDFRMMGDAAPTRIARPVQMVNRRTSVQEPEAQEKAASENSTSAVSANETTEKSAEEKASSDGAEQPRRRRSRMERRQQEEEQSPVEVQPEFDPFQAGDSEMPVQSRRAVPGGVYTGARTAMPRGGAAPERHGEVSQSENGLAPRTRQNTRPQGAPNPQRRPAQRPSTAGQTVPQNGQSRSAQGATVPQRRPAGQEMRTPAQRPVPPRRPVAEGENYTRVPQENSEQPYAYRAQGRPAYGEDSRQQPPVPRKPYDFENDDEHEEEVEQRRGGVLLPILIVLLVIGGLLAGICLPNWESSGGKVGQLISPVKNAVVTAFSNVKNMIVPEEEPIKSFTASTSDTEAPAALRLTIQTSKNIKGVRVADDDGNTLYARDYSQALVEEGEAIENSNELIWMPTCTLEDAYVGGFTVYAVKNDGTESEGVRTGTTVSIAAAKPVLPEMQDFTCQPENGTIPSIVTFTFRTSVTVTAVRVVDQYDASVAEMQLTDENCMTSETDGVRTWTVEAELTDDYTGAYFAQYRTDADAEYVDSTYSATVSFAAEDDASVQTGGDALPVETNAPVETEAPTQAPTDTPAPTNTPEPTATPEPTPEPTAEPDATPLPELTAEAVEEADPQSETMALKATVQSGGKSVTTFSRANTISILNPFTTYTSNANYAVWPQAGVLTFRSGPMRQNAAFGTAEVESGKLTEVWNQPVGSMKANSETLYGVNAPGQALIVKWPTQLRQRMALTDEARETVALKEVMIAGQDGKVYFYNLQDGTATREAIDLGVPSAGGLSLATNGTPLLGVGQSHSKVGSSVKKSGYHLLNLLTNKEEKLIQTDGKEKNSSFSGVLGAGLFDSKTGTLIFGSQGGVLYTVELGKQAETYDYQTGKITLSTTTQSYKTLAKGEEKKYSNINGSVAMYGSYVYYADKSGILQCVDVNSLTPVWAVNLGDDVEATPALDMEDESTVALYTGNTILLKRKQGVVNLNRINALTGEIEWTYEVPDVKYQSGADIGLEASPVVGQNGISDLVIFTITNGKEGSRTIALDKKTGALKWQADFTAEAYSSPVAVYNENGDAWIVQALYDGTVNLLNASNGQVLDTLTLPDAQIKASPAVYNDLLIIGTTGKKNSAVYCIRIN